MGRKRSKQEVMINKFGRMADNYQQKINNQQEIITRLMNALSIAQGALYDIENGSPNIEAARKVAKETSAKMAATLEKEKEVEQPS